MNCPRCDNVVSETDKFCPRCGSSLVGAVGFLLTTTPTIPGYKVKKVLGVVTGLTPRTRGVLGRFIAGIETLVGGEVSAFTSEMEKARFEALDRLRARAQEIGANAAIGVDLETTEVFQGVVLVTATGTAVVVEPEAAA
ncbi:MAG: heavy metal-binding domain-containing protein [Candidatus Bathyarchaeia archaeon]